MAERIQVELVDDIDGSPAQQTVTFALDGVTYEIDLNDRHAQQLRSLLARYVERARVPERDRPAPAGKRQEREERAQRQENKRLTEQIRGAAQRTKERLNQQKGAAESEPAAAERDVPALPEPAAGERTPGPQGEQPKQTVPAVSLPQFSSAVD